MDSSGMGRIGELLARSFVIAFAIVVVSVPLAIWKLIDIAIWLCK